MRVGSMISLCRSYRFHSPNLKHADIYLANNVTRQSVNERAGLQKILNIQYTLCDIKTDLSLPCITTFKHTHAASQCLWCNLKLTPWHSFRSYTRTHVHMRARTLFYSKNYTVLLRHKSFCNSCSHYNGHTRTHLHTAVFFSRKINNFRTHTIRVFWYKTHANFTHL